MKYVKKGFLTRIYNSSFEGNNYVGNFSHIYICSVGKMTYIGSNSSLIRTIIGRFCSISSNVKIIAGEHPTRLWVSTHPAFYKKNNACNVSFTDKDLFEEYKYVDSDNKYYVSIGNDVWIGSNVIIMNGVRIADGAVIASGSVVTKDVNPYSIVGGVPAKEIKKRFSEEQIEFLKNHPFWMQSDSWLREHSMDMENIDRYMYAINNTR